MKKINIVWAVLGLVCLSLAIYSVSSPSQTYDYNSSNNGVAFPVTNSRRYIYDGWEVMRDDCLKDQDTSQYASPPIALLSATHRGFPFFESSTHDYHCDIDHENSIARKYNRIFQIMLFVLGVGFFALVARNLRAKNAVKKSIR